MSTTEELERLLEAGRQRARSYRQPVFGPPDPARPLLPEHLTQLYHTPWYARLDPAQRLRYNQLCGLRANEVIMLFEDGFTRRVVRRLPSLLRLNGEPLLADCMTQLLADEARHHTMFRTFNRRWLSDGETFARLGRIDDWILSRLTRRPQRWPLLLWLILLLEEYSTALSRLLATPRRPNALGEPDAEYIRLHQIHLEDESRHLVYDRAVIRWLMERLPGSLAGLNARLFRLLLAEVVAPKRSAVAVVRRLVVELPLLREQESVMIRAVRQLGRDPGIGEVLDDPAALPLLRDLVGHYPGFGWWN